MVFNRNNAMACFGAAIDATRIYETTKHHEVLVFFHQAGHHAETLRLLRAFEKYAKRKAFAYYTVPVYLNKIKSSTRRCFVGPPYHFKEYSYTFRRIL